MAREKQKLQLRSPSEVSERAGSAVLLDNLPLIRERFTAVGETNNNSISELVRLLEQSKAIATATPEGTEVDTEKLRANLSDIDKTITSARKLRAQVDEAAHYSQLLGDWSLHAELVWVSLSLLAVSQHVREQPIAAAASLEALRLRVNRLLELPDFTG